ncbi:MAG TPA: hypothetical protein VL485_32560 [Ktedonobacteraceae bacterium]|jgi:hypothetical protein|nr:hypothetical protein [Ktedonobacteraceae bacterium]
MSSDNGAVTVNPSDLQNGGSQMASAASNIAKIGPTIDKAISTLEGGISGAPLGAFPAAIDVLHGRIQISLKCAEDRLAEISKILPNIANEFQTLDVQLAATLNALAQESQQAYAGYEVQTAPAKPAPQPKSGGFSWGKLLKGAGIFVGGLALGAAATIATPVTGGASDLADPLAADGMIAGAGEMAEAFTGAAAADTAASSATVDASTALSADSIAAAESTAAGATLSEADINAIVSRESSGLDAELEQYFSSLAGAH